jgi:hypothetical protein
MKKMQGNKQIYFQQFLFFFKKNNEKKSDSAREPRFHAISLSLSLSLLFGKVGNRQSPLQKNKKIILLVALETI